jgi:quinol monooxygenase YgiN
VLIVSGRLYIVSGLREDFLASSEQAMIQARQTPGCRDFIVAADPIDPARVNIYEEWESKETLSRFRGQGPGEDLSSMIVRAEVSEHVVVEDN